MDILKGNIFTDVPSDKELPESFETLIQTPALLIERIVSNSGFHSPGQWYDQNKDEWVLLLQGNAELEFENNEIIRMKKGDFILIPKHKTHRIKKVSKRPNCIWLGIHADMK